MQVIKPTKQEVFKELRQFTGCCWLGGTGCECRSRQLGICYKEAEQRLTKTILTDEEIKQAQEKNQKSMDAITNALNELFGD